MALPVPVSGFVPPPKSGDGIDVSYFGPLAHTVSVYLYADLLEELQFNAEKGDYYGMLVGTLNLLPVKENDATSGMGLVYLEVTGFKDLFPTTNALEYAAYLRKQRDFRTSLDNPGVLGVVVIKKDLADPTLEDLFLMRSYFGDQTQIALYITENRDQPRAYVLGDSFESFAESGYWLVKLADEKLPFNPK